MIRKALSGVASLISGYWAAHSVKGRIWLAMGTLALAVDAWLCYQYGVTQTVGHGIGFAVVALVFSQLPDGAYEEWTKGHKVSGAILGIICIPLGIVAYQSHIGYGAGVRLGDIKQASMQDARYDGAQATAKERAANLDLWRKQLSDLIERDAWTGTVTADALRAELATLGERIASEKDGKRGRRAGCGKECERLQNEANEVALKLGKVEQRADLSRRIEATQRLVDAARDTAGHTQAGMSSVAMQTTANTQMFGIIRAYWTGESLEQSLKTTEDSAKLANIIITAMGALAFMLMAPVGFFMAGRNRSILPETYAGRSFPQAETAGDFRLHEVRREVHEIKQRDPRINGALAFLETFKAA